MVTIPVRKPIPWIWLIIVLSAVTVLTFSALYGIFLRGEERFVGGVRDMSVTVVAKPVSMDEFVNKRDIIVIGTVGTVIREGIEGPYNPEALGNDPRDVPKPGQEPFTYYKIEIEEVILDDGTIRAGKSLVLRVNGLSNNEATSGNMMPMPQTGDHFLFALGRNPDGASYGHWGPWGLLNIDGEVVRFSDWERTPINFTANKSPEGFLAELKERVEAR